MVAEHVLATDAHPSAEEIFAAAHRRLPVLSRATVYNTLSLFVERGLLRALVLAEGHIVYDPRLEPHHHFIDDETGRIHDVPRHALTVTGVDDLTGFDVREHSVVLRGRLSRPS